MAIRLAVPPCAIPHAIPTNTITSIKATCGLQKQFCPAQAFSVLYSPMAIRPPRVDMTSQLASPNTHPSPHQSPAITITADTTVRMPLYHELNRLSRTQPTAPRLSLGGGSAGGGPAIHVSSHIRESFVSSSSKGYASVIDVSDKGIRKAHGEIGQHYQHEYGHCGRRLGHGLRDVRQVRVPDCRCQAAVLGQVQVLADGRVGRLPAGPGGTLRFLLSPWRRDRVNEMPPSGPSPPTESLPLRSPL